MQDLLREAFQGRKSVDRWAFRDIVARHVGGATYEELRALAKRAEKPSVRLTPEEEERLQLYKDLDEFMLDFKQFEFNFATVYECLATRKYAEFFQRRHRQSVMHALEKIKAESPFGEEL